MESTSIKKLQNAASATFCNFSVQVGSISKPNIVEKNGFQNFSSMLLPDWAEIL
jgi:hypothetical protein